MRFKDFPLKNFSYFAVIKRKNACKNLKNAVITIWLFYRLDEMFTIIYLCIFWIFYPVGSLKLTF